MGNFQCFGGAPSWIMNWRALKIAAWSSVLFLVVYNACNWITARRVDVGEWVFEWERHIPLVPWMIVPYWSLDALFVAGPFLTRDRRSLDALERRLTFAILAAAVCFLSIPLRFAFPRPHVEGIFGPWFDVLHGFDAPHNLFPSLHIALRTIHAEHYGHHTRGVWRWLSHVWFSLVGVSTLLTYQHHVIDIAGGFLLGAACIRMFPRGQAAAPAETQNRFVGGLYLAGALAGLQAARVAWPTSVVMVWPATALALVGCNYLGLGACVYHKRSGRLSRASNFWLAPVRLGQWFSWRYYRRRSARCDRITPRVWIGPHPDDSDADRLIGDGVSAVLDMTVEFSAPDRLCRETVYRNVPVLDLTAPTPAQMREIAAFIDGEARRGTVFVHCKAGYSRSAAAVGAWLIASGQAGDAGEAIRHLKRSRTAMIVRPEVVRALDDFAAALASERKSAAVAAVELSVAPSEPRITTQP